MLQEEDAGDPDDEAVTEQRLQQRGEGGKGGGGKKGDDRAEQQGKAEDQPVLKEERLFAGGEHLQTGGDLGAQDVEEDAADNDVRDAADKAEGGRGEREQKEETGSWQQGEAGGAAGGDDHAGAEGEIDRSDHAAKAGQGVRQSGQGDAAADPSRHVGWPQQSGQRLDGAEVVDGEGEIAEEKGDQHPRIEMKSESETAKAVVDGGQWQLFAGAAEKQQMDQGAGDNPPDDQGRTPQAGEEPIGGKEGEE